MAKQKTSEEKGRFLENALRKAGFDPTWVCHVRRREGTGQRDAGSATFASKEEAGRAAEWFRSQGFENVEICDPTSDDPDWQVIGVVRPS